MTQQNCSSLEALKGAWFAAERYWLGRILELATAEKPVILFELETGKTVLVEIPSELHQAINDRIHQQVMLHVLSEERLDTDQVRNIKAVEIVEYDPKFDEEQFGLMVKQGCRQWASIDDVNAWLADLRGGSAEA